MAHKVGEIVTYDTPLSGEGIYEAEVLELEAENIYKVKILKIIRISRNPIAPQKIGDIDHVLLPLHK